VQLSFRCVFFRLVSYTERPLYDDTRAGVRRSQLVSSFYCCSHVGARFDIRWMLLKFMRPRVRPEYILNRDILHTHVGVILCIERIRTVDPRHAEIYNFVHIKLFKSFNCLIFYTVHFNYYYKLNSPMWFFFVFFPFPFIVCYDYAVNTHCYLQENYLHTNNIHF